VVPGSRRRPPPLRKARRYICHVVWYKGSGWDGEGMMKELGMKQVMPPTAHRSVNLIDRGVRSVRRRAKIKPALWHKCLCILCCLWSVNPSFKCT